MVLLSRACHLFSPVPHRNPVQFADNETGSHKVQVVWDKCTAKVLVTFH
jgi:hypothetical protein